jgi:hypothetical protein
VPRMPRLRSPAATTTRMASGIVLDRPHRSKSEPVSLARNNSGSIG